MTDDSERLQLARRAWHATAPTDAEIHASVRRLQVALAKRRTHRAAAWRRSIAIGLGLLALGAAAAYAAHGALQPASPVTPPDGEGSRHQLERAAVSLPGAAKPAPSASDDSASEHQSIGRDPRIAADTPLQALPRAASAASAALPCTDSAQSRSRGSVPAADRDEVVAAPKQRDRSLLPSPTPAYSGPPRNGVANRSSWERVDQALANGDTAEARRVLRALAHDDDVVTSAKARLGLAQLAVRRGDCARARALVSDLALAPGVPSKLITRGRRLVLGCE